MPRYIDVDAVMRLIPMEEFVARMAIANAPTADVVEQKKGKWTREWLSSTNGGCYEVFRCSECKEAFNWRMKYCGNCGAKMDEEEPEITEEDWHRDEWRDEWGERRDDEN